MVPSQLNSLGVYQSRVDIMGIDFFHISQLDHIGEHEKYQPLDHWGIWTIFQEYYVYIYIYLYICVINIVVDYM